MRIKVYQINKDLDRHDASFISYDSTLKAAGRVDSSIYKTVYDGDIECAGLEDVFQKLNGDEPPEYQGHSLSVSDVVEVCDENAGVPKGSYFCDTIGFKKLEDFDTEKTEPLHGKKMVVVLPHKPAYEAIVGNGLEDLQRAVQGLIEITYPFDDNAAVIGNDEAKLIGMEGNRHIGMSIYAGPLLIAGDDGEGDFMDLTDAQVDRYKKMFAMPEDISDDEVQGDIGFRFFSF